MGLLHIFAAGMDRREPEKRRETYGIYFISRFKLIREDYEPPLVEGTYEDKVVKAWLIGLGVEESELYWLSKPDIYRVTLFGLQPRILPLDYDADGKLIGPPLYLKSWREAH